MIFEDSEVCYQPINILLASGVQETMLKRRLQEKLRLQPKAPQRLKCWRASGNILLNGNEYTLKNTRARVRPERIPVFSSDKPTASSSAAMLCSIGKKFIKKGKFVVVHLINWIVLYETPLLGLPSGLDLSPTIFGCTISASSRTGSSTIKSTSQCR